MQSQIYQGIRPGLLQDDGCIPVHVGRWSKPVQSQGFAVREHLRKKINHIGSKRRFDSS
jgi:hypothetical protein